MQLHSQSKHDISEALYRASKQQDGLCDDIVLIDQYEH